MYLLSKPLFSGFRPFWLNFRIFQPRIFVVPNSVFGALYPLPLLGAEKNSCDFFENFFESFCWNFLRKKFFQQIKNLTAVRERSFFGKIFQVRVIFRFLFYPNFSSTLILVLNWTITNLCSLKRTILTFQQIFAVNDKFGPESPWS